MGEMYPVAENDTVGGFIPLNSPNLPYLRATETSKQLIIDGAPFLMLAGELNNSSMSCPEYMNEIWPKLKDAHINTVLGNVTWEDIEPVRGQFSFGRLDAIVSAARKYGIKLVLLWFGSFKNGLSSYVPSWVKKDPKNFPRAKLRQRDGTLKTSETLSIFHENSLQADAAAFSAFMKHIKEIDQDHHTILMVQVENEPGLLGDSRDRSPAANTAFAQPVPQEVRIFLQEQWENLNMHLRENLRYFQLSKTCAGDQNWEQMFNGGLATDELFMAYHYALYLDRIARAGKEIYPLPMFVNAWQNHIAAETPVGTPVVVGGGGQPGIYPSGGPTVNVLPIWQQFAPALDFIAPDIYLNDYSQICKFYRHGNQPLFIPEQRRDEYGARRMWEAIGTHAAIGVSPFGIDTIDWQNNPIARHYALMTSVKTLILEAQSVEDKCFGFYFDEPPKNGEKDRYTPIQRCWGGFNIHIERCFVFGAPGPAAGIIIHYGDGKFLLLGWGFQVIAHSTNVKSTFTGILSFEEKVVEDSSRGLLKTSRLLNGDESRSGTRAMMPNEYPDYGSFPIPSTIPAGTGIAEVTFYSLTEDDE